MKSNIITKVFVSGAMAALILGGCAKQEAYQPGEPDVEGCLGVYFPVSVDPLQMDPSTAPDVTEIDITVARATDTDNVSVPFVIKQDGNVFSAASDKIEFVDGQKETTLTILVNKDKAEVGTTYTANISVTDPKYVSTYTSNATSVALSAVYVKWNVIGDCLYREDILSSVFGLAGANAEISIEIEERADLPGYYRIWDLYGTKLLAALWANQYPEEEFEENVTTHNYFYIDATDPNKVVIPWQNLGVVLSSSYGEFWAGQDGNPAGAAAGYGKLENKIITFPASGLYMGEESTVRWYANYDGLFRLALPGAVLVDYSLEIEADYPSDGVTPIYVEAGVDVNSIKYAVFEGKLDESDVNTKVKEIISGTIKSEVLDELELSEEESLKYATLEITPEASGIYTIVVVGLDAENTAQESAYTSFNFISAEDQDDYKVTVSVFTEDTPARYQKLHAYDSFAYGIAGEELTDVHVGIFKEATVAQYGSDYIMSVVKNNEGGNYAASADDLAAINSDGGFYDVLTGLEAKTTYYLIVWATNGSMDDFAVASYTTDKLPYVWNEIGKGTLTDGFFVSLFSRPDYTVPCTLYAEANNPGLYMMTDYQLPLVAAFFSMTEEAMLPYEGGNWNKTELIIDATDPTAVVISEQDYGVCVNSAYGFVLIDTEATGTLVDGVITFPAKNMYVGLGGDWYYGNQAGTFAIRFPEAVAAAPAAAPVVAKANASVENVEFTSAFKADRPNVVYERDAQPVKTNVNVTYTRKAKKDNPQKILPTIK